MSRAMKDSGIEWIGEIPEAWEVRKLNAIAETITDYVASGSFASLNENVQYLDEPDYAMLVRTVDFSDSNTKSVYINEHSYNFLSNSNLFGGEIILSNIGSVGSVFYYEPMYEKASLAPNAVMLRMNGNNKFYYYWFLSPNTNDELKRIGSSAIQMKFNKTQLRALRAICPSEDEQNHIAEYLDLRTTLIDQTIQKQKLIIEKLKEYKQSVITEAVTKGLNNDVPMKDSGIEWVGKIPEHFRVGKLKFVTDILTCGYAATPEYVDSGIPFLSAQNVKNGKLNLQKYNFIKLELHEKLTKYKRPMRGDILQVRVGATIGQTCIVDTDLIFSVYVSLSHIRSNALMNNRFLSYFIGMNIFINEALNVTFQGGGVGNLNVADLRKMPVIIPKYEEQVEISEYLDEKCKKIEGAIQLKSTAIKKLEFYKKSLIYECVTGKREVK